MIDLPSLPVVSQIVAPEPERVYTNELLAAAAVIVVAVLVVCFLKPTIGKFVGKLAAIALMGLGVAGLVWGILAAARGDQPPSSGPLAGASYNFVIGCGAGSLTAGVVALILACLIRVPVPFQDTRPRVG